MGILILGEPISGIRLLSLSFTAAALFVPYSERQMLAVSAGVWAVYLVPILLTRTSIEHAGAWTQGFLLACATVIGITASRFASRLREREFMSRQAPVEEEGKVEDLLLNILPGPIAERLKEEEKNIADAFSKVTILFADIVGFTRMSAQMSPGAVVAMLNEVFSDFDRLTERHRLEKIKTIGDAYMVAGGLHVGGSILMISRARAGLSAEAESAGRLRRAGRCFRVKQAVAAQV
jgi:adenylate cyclase